jgi:hypothetical protein
VPGCFIAFGLRPHHVAWTALTFVIAASFHQSAMLPMGASGIGAMGGIGGALLRAIMVADHDQAPGRRQTSAVHKGEAPEIARAV